jgi:signal recognition particle GTPase
LAELKSLLAVKEQLTELETRKAALEKELTDVSGRIAKLIGGMGSTAPARRAKPGRKPARKKAAKKVAKKAAKKPVKKTVKKAVKRTVKKTSKKTASKATGKQTVEQVVIDLIRANGAPMPFQEILSAITSRKLVKSKSKNFANVLRRTLSTSASLVRAGRGIYKVK